MFCFMNCGPHPRVVRVILSDDVRARPGFRPDPRAAPCRLSRLTVGPQYGIDS